MDDPDLHPQGRRRHHLALVRRAESRKYGRAGPTAYGTIDEAGLGASASRRRALRRRRRGDRGPTSCGFSEQLFVAGAELATAPEAAERLEDGVSRVTDADGRRLEPIIDRYMDRVELPPKFVIPGGTPLSAQLDVARTMVRRAERRVIELRDAEGLRRAVLAYLNRASDLV